MSINKKGMIRIRSFIICIVLLLLTTSSAFSKSSKIVDVNHIYTYEIMQKDIKKLKEKFPSLIEIKSIGKTKFNRDIWAIKLGKGKEHILINGAHHGREWITTSLIMKMIEEYANSYISQSSIYGEDIQILDKVSIWFIPMVNPDGVTLQQKGLSAFPKQYHKKLLEMNQGDKNFKRWKANAEGIDLNRQYPANWDNLNTEYDKPSYKYYKGEKPLQAVETKSLVDFTYKIKPTIAVSYHSSGRVLYWYFHNDNKIFKRDYCIAKRLSFLTGYSLIPKKRIDKNDGGGYTDWFIQEFKKPGFTPELSFLVKETNPPLSVFPNEWRRNKSLGLVIANEGFHLLEQEDLGEDNYFYEEQCDGDFGYNLLHLVESTFEKEKNKKPQ